MQNETSHNANEKATVRHSVVDDLEIQISEMQSLSGILSELLGYIFWHKEDRGVVTTKQSGHVMFLAYELEARAGNIMKSWENAQRIDDQAAFISKEVGDAEITS